MQVFRLIYLVKQELVVELLYLSRCSPTFLLLQKPIIENNCLMQRDNLEELIYQESITISREILHNIVC